MASNLTVIAIVVALVIVVLTIDVVAIYFLNKVVNRGQKEPGRAPADMGEVKGS
jgi:Na+-transporting methylmalonyl-CoA/oxaloacetate decarboxylase gamma subunit